MKKTLLIIALLLSVTSYSQINNDSVRINNLEKQIKRLNDSINKIKQDDTSLYNLRNDILNTKKNQEDIYEDWITKWSELFFILFGFVGGLLGFLGLKEAVKRQAIKKIAEITGKSIKDIEENYEQYVKHNLLKKDSKILVLNQKDTDFPLGFKKVMKLFYIDVNDKKNLIEVEKLEDALSDDNISKMREADVIVIENQENKIKDEKKGVNDEKKSLWELGDLRSIKTMNEITQKAQTDNSFKNIKTLIELAEKICNKTAIVYYGQQGKGNFPSDFVDPDKQHMITFANAPSQLYGNMLNMLKFKNELENA